MYPLRTAPDQTNTVRGGLTPRDCGEERRRLVGRVSVAAFQEEASPWNIGGTLRIICSDARKGRAQNPNKRKTAFCEGHLDHLLSLPLSLLGLVSEADQ